MTGTPSPLVEFGDADFQLNETKIPDRPKLKVRHDESLMLFLNKPRGGKTTAARKPIKPATAHRRRGFITSPEISAGFIEAGAKVKQRGRNLLNAKLKRAYN